MTPARTALRAAALILSKDLMVEIRTREVLLTMSLFAVLVVVIFAFAFQLDVDGTRAVAPGLLWVTVVFAGNLGIARVMDKERENGAFQGLILAPGGPIAVFIGKAVGVFVFMLLMELLVVPLALLFIGISLPSSGLALLVAALVLGTLGFALVGTLFGAMLADVRMREVLIPVVVYPVVVPVLVAGVKLTAHAFSPSLDDDASFLGLMAGFDLIYLALAPWVFARVLTE
jgi:heme exporter protein B